jgi:hypothetical protein
MLVSWQRFGMGVIGVSSVIAAVGMLLYMRDATPSPQSHAAPQSAALFEKAARPIPADEPAGVQIVVDEFVAALERQSEVDMRRLFPAMTEREARILLAIRKRLGHAALRAETKHVTSATGGAVQIDFVIRAQTRGGDRERRLPFSALLDNSNSHWQIVSLR